MYQNLYDRAKKIVRKDACMKFYDVARPLYLETNASSISIGTGLLQVKDGMNCWHDEVLDNAILHPIVFAIKCLPSA